MVHGVAAYAWFWFLEADRSVLCVREDFCMDWGTDFYGIVSVYRDYVLHWNSFYLFDISCHCVKYNFVSHKTYHRICPYKTLTNPSNNKHSFPITNLFLFHNNFLNIFNNLLFFRLIQKLILNPRPNHIILNILNYFNLSILF